MEYLGRSESQPGPKIEPGKSDSVNEWPRGEIMGLISEEPGSIPASFPRA
jgi:hypothetical protein